MDDEGRGAEDPDSQDDVPALSSGQVEMVIKKVRGELLQHGTDVPEFVLSEILSPTLAGVAIQVTETVVSQHVGPLPSAQAMKEYAEVYPEGPKQLFEQLKREQDHRHSWENNALSGQVGERTRRDFLMFGAVGLGILAALVLGVWTEQPIAAAVLIGLLILGGGALALGRQLLATHSANGSTLQVNKDL